MQFQCIMQVVDWGRRKLSTEYHLLFRLFKALLVLGVLAIIITLFIICELSMIDLFICCIAFLPTVWGLLLVSSYENWCLGFQLFMMIQLIPDLVSSDCSSCEAQDWELWNMGLCSGPCSSLWLWNGSFAFCTNGCFGVAPFCIWISNSLSFQPCI